MEEKQIKLLKELAEKVKAEKRDRKAVIATLQSAKILTQKENFTGHLKKLEKVFITVE